MGDRNVYIFVFDSFQTVYLNSTEIKDHSYSYLIENGVFVIVLVGKSVFHPKPVHWHVFPDKVESVSML